MQLDRINLADIHAPIPLARALHKQIGDIEQPYPVDEIAMALDITEVRVETLDGVEGMLLTDRVRSRGAILANDRHGTRRARFTIAHELGHFLLERHVLSDESGFRCTSQDLREPREDKLHRRQEAEANLFAIELLAPGPIVARHLSADPDLRDAQRLRNALNVSLEACARRMLECRDEVLAAIWSEQEQVRYVVRNPRFPYILLGKGDRLPQSTQAFHVISNGRSGFTKFAETHGNVWTTRPDLDLFEQTRVGKNGHAVTLLWADMPEEDADDDVGLPELGVPRFR